MKDIARISIVYPGEGCKVIKVKRNGLSNNQLLERVFAWFNAGSNQECRAFLNWRKRSLSVNDCVGIDGFWWQCASVGWDTCCFRYVAQLDKEVRERPEFKTGAWFALDRVMSERRAAARAANCKGENI